LASIFLSKKENKMKSVITRTIELAIGAALTLSLGIAVVAVISAFAFASGGSGQSVDSSTSTTLFFQGSRANPASVNTGVARVAGIVKLDTKELDNSVFDLVIFPADGGAGSALTGYVAGSAHQTLLTFKSRRVRSLRNGKFQVVGDFTLTQIEQSVPAPTEAYAGSGYGNPLIHTQTREITFLFPRLSAVPVSETLRPATLQANGTLQISGTALVVHEDFPELSSAIEETNWPPVLQNEECRTPSSPGEDYSGTQCTGTVIAATRTENCRLRTSVGEDFSGAVCMPPAGDQTTIVLHLKLLRTGSEYSAETISPDSTIR
jgi:polyisoprenoid-binding protein YceI